MGCLRIVSNLCLALAVLSAGCADTVYVMYEHHELDGDERIPAGSGCLVAVSSSLRNQETSAGFGIGDDLLVEWSGPGDSFMLEVRTKGELIETREYSEKKLRSGKHDPFTIKTASGRSYELDYWGTDECDPPGIGVR